MDIDKKAFCGWCCCGETLAGRGALVQWDFVLQDVQMID